MPSFQNARMNFLLISIRKIQSGSLWRVFVIFAVKCPIFSCGDAACSPYTLTMHRQTASFPENLQTTMKIHALKKQNKDKRKRKRDEKWSRRDERTTKERKEKQKEKAKKHAKMVKRKRKRRKKTEKEKEKKQRQKTEREREKEKKRGERERETKKQKKKLAFIHLHHISLVTEIWKKFWILVQIEDSSSEHIFTEPSKQKNSWLICPTLQLEMSANDLGGWFVSGQKLSGARGEIGQKRSVEQEFLFPYKYRKNYIHDIFTFPPGESTLELFGW